jgi:hypothetical protein
MEKHSDKEPSAIPQPSTSQDLGAMLLMAGAAQAINQIQPLTAGELRLLAAYRRSEDSRLLFESMVRMVNSLP